MRFHLPTPLWHSGRGALRAMRGSLQPVLVVTSLYSIQSFFSRSPARVKFAAADSVGKTGTTQSNFIHLMDGFLRVLLKFPDQHCSSSMSRDQNIWYQREITLPSQKRGCHLVTDHVVSKTPELHDIKIGLAHIHIKHTSASLALNENWDPDVRVDTEMMLNKIVPEGQNYKHSCEGPDDMPAHIKAALIGSSVTIPITDGQFNLGTWQGLWLCEHRNHAGSRKLVVTIQGMKK